MMNIFTMNLTRKCQILGVMHGVKFTIFLYSKFVITGISAVGTEDAGARVARPGSVSDQLVLD